MSTDRRSVDDLAALMPLRRLFPNLPAAVAELARLSALLTLPKGTVHIISDVHGEDRKLRHIINNASGTLRPVVERLFGERLGPDEMQQFLALVFYPNETIEMIRPTLKTTAARQEFARSALRMLFELIRELALQLSLPRALRCFPQEFRQLLQEMVFHQPVGAGQKSLDAIVSCLVAEGQETGLLHQTVRAARNLAVDELILAGDCWDRGPRGDRVVSYLEAQPNVVFTWGNHDAAWLGAALGQPACIMHVLRVSARYRRFSQLEEGYGITLQPLELLVRTMYGDDPADSFKVKNTGLRDTILMQRMQKAAAVMQYKLEGQTIERNPQWNLGHRRLLHTIDFQAGTVVIDGKTYPLKDKSFPTIDPQSPYQLSEEEQACLDRIRESFLASRVLAEQMEFMVGQGSMYLVRDKHLIFHGCLPVDERGEFLPLEIDGFPERGREQFDALERVVSRALSERREADLDLLWYLWCGPISPLFGKDRICTFENDLVEAHETHVETKNPYFTMIHEKEFCERILKEFGVDTERGLIVNGHVPVKIDKGENPLKRSGKAITIDGAFSEAYGDHGYTLVLEPERTYLALHHHFESVEAAIRDGVDIVPTVTPIRDWGETRTVGQTERGHELRVQMELLRRLIDAYRANKIRQSR